MKSFDCYDQSEFITFDTRAVDPCSDLDEFRARLMGEVFEKMDEIYGRLQSRVSDIFKEFREENTRIRQSMEDLGAQIKEFVDEEANNSSQYEVFDEMTKPTMEIGAEFGVEDAQIQQLSSEDKAEMNDLVTEYKPDEDATASEVELEVKVVKMWMLDPGIQIKEELLEIPGAQSLNITLGVKEFAKVEEEIIRRNKQPFLFPITMDDLFWAFGMLGSRVSCLRNQNIVAIPFDGFINDNSKVNTDWNPLCRLIVAFMSTAIVKRVGTHNGNFHCDEALSCFLTRLAKSYRFADIEAFLESHKCRFQITEVSFFYFLIRSYGDTGMIKNAVSVCNKIANFSIPPSTHSFNTLILACNTTEGYYRAPVYFDKFPENFGFVPNAFSYGVLVKAVCEMGSLEKTIEVLNEIEKKGVEIGFVLFSMILHKLYKMRRVYEVEKVWEEMVKEKEIELNVGSYSVKLSQMGDQLEFVLIEEMGNSGMYTDVISYNKRGTLSFSAKKLCDRRRYVYLLLVFALDPLCHCDRESVFASGGLGNELMKCVEYSERGRKVFGVVGQSSSESKIEDDGGVSSINGSGSVECKIVGDYENENGDVEALQKEETERVSEVLVEDKIAYGSSEKGQEYGGCGNENSKIKMTKKDESEFEKKRTEADDPYAHQKNLSFNANTVLNIEEINIIKYEVIEQSIFAFVTLVGGVPYNELHNVELKLTKFKVKNLVSATEGLKFDNSEDANKMKELESICNTVVVKMLLEFCNLIPNSGE